MEYKAGDKVILKNKRGWHWNGQGLMDRYMGQTVTIKNVFDQTAFVIEEDASWTFMFDDIDAEAMEV